VTLRTDLHAALDEVAVNGPMVRAQVLATVAAERARRRRGGSRWSGSDRIRQTFTFSFRQMAALAAGLIVVLLMATLVAGGRLLRDLEQRGSVDQQVVDQLTARPFRAPALKATDPCPTETLTTVDYGNGPQPLYGSGPVYAIGVHETDDAWGGYFDARYITRPGLTGLVLVRGGDARSGPSLVFIGMYATGPSLGSDTYQGKLVRHQSYLVFDARHPFYKGWHGYGVFPVLQGIQHGYSGCWVVQIDGLGFSETIFGAGGMIPENLP
jgi:hypothetical protein